MTRKVDKLYKKGLSSFKKGNYIQAKKYFDKALKKDPENAKILSDKGATLVKLGRIDEALSFLTRALKINPNLKNTRDTIEYIKRKFNKTPTSPEVNKKYETLFDKGVIALKKARPKEALSFFKEAVKLVDNDAELFCNMGASYLQLKQISKGKHFLKKALELDPRNPIALLNFGLVQAIKGKYDEAIQTIEKLLEYNPHFSQARPILMKIKRQKKAFGNIKKEDKDIPSNATESFAKGVNFMQTREFEKARASFEKALKIYPNFAEAYLYLGMIDQALEHKKSALEYFNKALKYNSKSAEAWYHIGAIFDSQNKYQKALESYDKAIELNPNLSAIYNNKGLALDALERYEEAIDCYSKSIELNPDFEGVWYNRATTYKKMKQIERALSDYKKALELNPFNESAREEIEHLRRLSNMSIDGKFRSVADSRDYCPRCGKKNLTDHGVCQYCGTHMEVESIEDLLDAVIKDESIGNFERALMNLVRINQKDPTLTQAWYLRGKAHCALGEFQNALMCFSKCQQLGDSPFKMMMYGLMAKRNAESFKSLDLSQEHLSKVEIEHIGFFPNDDSWNANGAALQMLMQYEKAYKCYQYAKDHPLAKQNMKVIENLAIKGKR